MRLNRSAAVTLPLLLCLAACGEDAPAPAPETDDGRAALGEVLPGSISDTMIEGDTLKSQPPLLVDEPVAAAPADNAAAAAETGEDGAGAANAAAASEPQAAPAE